MSLASLFHPCEQAGYLLKQGHSWSTAFHKRYFVLKGGFLFYFSDRKEPQRASKLHGVIPLENAKIETELPPNTPGPPRRREGGFPITITLHTAHAFSCRHPFYVLVAPTQEIQMAWVNAMWQAAIPRSDLIQHLASAGKLADVLASYAHAVKNNFPVADAGVLSTDGRARTAALADVGSLAGMIRRHKAPPAVSDLAQLPMVATDRPSQPANVLARTASGNLVTAPGSSIMRPSEVAPAAPPAAAVVVPAQAPTPEPAVSTTGRGIASDSGSSTGSSSPSRIPSPPPTSTPAAAAVASGSKTQAATGVVVVSAAAGTAAAAASAAMPATEKAGAEKAGAKKDSTQPKVIQEQIERLEREAAAGAAAAQKPPSLREQQEEQRKMSKQLSVPAGSHGFTGSGSSSPTAGSPSKHWKDNPLAGMSRSGSGVTAITSEGGAELPQEVPAS